MKIKAINDTIIATDGDLGDQVTESGIVVKANTEKSDGITPRWFRVFDSGPEIKDVQHGDWVLVSYGRWTPHFRFTDDRVGEEVKMWRIDPEGIMATADEKPHTMYFNTEAATADKKVR